MEMKNEILDEEMKICMGEDVPWAGNQGRAGAGGGRSHAVL